MSDLVTTTVNDNVLTLALNRPDRLNALTRDLMTELRQALSHAAQDEAIRAVCLTGAGRGFCAGQDLAERDPRAHPHPFDLEALQHELYHPAIKLIAEMEKPVVAKVGGIAAGAGVSLALACDIVIAAASARFALSFSKVGLSVDAGGGWALTRSLGPARARALLMLGGTMSAEEAERAGMIFRTVPDTELDAQTDAVLGQLAGAPRIAMRAIKQAIQAANQAPDLNAYLAREAALQGEAGRDPDYAEGVLSFLEKRPPAFR